MRRYGELIAAVVQLVQGDGAARGTVDGYLAAMRQNEELKLMANALEQLLGGERDADRLCDGLHYDPAMLIETILAALADPRCWRNCNRRGTACGGTKTDLRTQRPSPHGVPVCPTNRPTVRELGTRCGGPIVWAKKIVAAAPHAPPGSGKRPA
ncbi:MAG: hypothetical protein R2932_00125 [Caldilineaceae bacterium]